MDIQVKHYNIDNAEDYRHFIHKCDTALIQQSWEWGRIIKDLGHDKPIFLLAKDENDNPVGAMPAYVYKCDPVSLLISVPQAGGYGGVIVGNENLRDEIYAALAEALIAEARTQGCALATISTQPFFGEINLYRQYFKPDFEQENFYQYIDLNSDFMAEISSKQRGNIKRGIQKAEKCGLKVTFADSDEYFNQWYKIHEQRMAELNAIPLPKKLFDGARQCLFKENLGFFAYVFDNDRIIGGGLFVGLNKVVDVFLVNSSSAIMHKQPNNILVSAAIKRAREMGFRYFNWQSCSSRESGVYAFKKSWGSREGNHYYLTKITGDISGLKEISLDELKRRYRWHYVMPYDQFQEAQLEEA